MYLIAIITIAMLLTLLLYRLQLRASQRREFRSSLHLGTDLAPRLRISVVVGAAQSVGYIASLLKSDSNAYQVVVVDDFDRHAKLLEAITHHFGLIKVSNAPSGKLPHSAVRGAYRSLRRLYSKLMIVDSPRDEGYTPLQVGAALSSYDYTLLLDSHHSLRPGAIDDLLLELALRPEGGVEEIHSQRGERIKLVRREEAMALSTRVRGTRSRLIINIDYKILK